MVTTDLAPRWSVVRLYERRFRSEVGFRTEKSKGWQWEASQVQGVMHHERLLLAMAWTSLVVLCLGVEEAQRMAVAWGRVWRKQLRPVRQTWESVFTLQRWVFGTESWARHWWLPQLDARSWER